MKTTTLLSILVILAIIVGCAPKTQQPLAENKQAAIDFLTYENSDYGFKISYPPTWEQKETPDLITAFVSPKTGAADALQENLGLTMNDLSGQNLDLQGFNEVAINQLKQTFQDIKILDTNPTTLSGNPAHKVIFTAMNLKFIQVWTVKNDLAYIWSFASEEKSYPDYLETVQKMLDSFEITKNIRE